MLKGPIAILEADAGVRALVGKNKADAKYKVFPVVSPQPENIPYVTAILTGKVKIGKGGCGHAVTFDVRSYAKSYDEVEALDLACVAALDGKTPGEVNDVKMGYINSENTVDSFVSEPKPIYVKVSTFSTTVE